MRFSTLHLLLVLTTVAHSSAIPWLRLLPLFVTLNEPVEGFFGIFRRRQPPPLLKEVPEGPVRFPVQSQESFGANPFIPQSIFPRPGSQGFFGGNVFYPQNNFRPSGFQGNWFNNWNAPIESMQNLPQTPKFEPEEQTLDSEFDRNVRFDDQPPAINTEEAESFFTLLAETDENKCISRLVCEMGADPNTAGDLGQTVTEIIGSLTDFPPGSKVSEYNEILRSGRSDGTSFCLSKYSACDEETYHLMKSNQPEEMAD